jgi:hypothetical protein
VQHVVVKPLKKHRLNCGDVQSVFLPQADVCSAFDKGSSPGRVSCWVATWP